MSLKKANRIPKIALVGPTNVGKSSLFNRLTRSKRAIVCDRSGVTVDRHALTYTPPELTYPIELIDTGGMGRQVLAEHALGKEIHLKAQQSLSEADLILLVVDGTQDIDTDLWELTSLIRKQQQASTQVFVLANKVDCKRHNVDEFYALGFDKVFAVSSEHNLGIADLWTAVDSFCWEQELVCQEEPESISQSSKVMVIGRPNTGKSSLLNAITRSDRHVVSAVSGTTRDPIESKLLLGQDVEWSLCDTAGIRRPGRLDRGVEWVAKEKIKKLLKHADLALMVFDSTEGITDLDISIINLAMDAGCSLLFVLNKWDLVEHDEDKQSHVQRGYDLRLKAFCWVPIVSTNAKEAVGIGDLLKEIKGVLAARGQRAQTSKVNKFFESRIKGHSHPLIKGYHTAKFYYMSQVSNSPPKFLVSSNVADDKIHFSYRRYVVNCLREEFGFQGTPIQLEFRKHK